MADIEFASFSLTGAPALIFSGVGLIEIYGANAQTLLCDSAGGPAIALPVTTIGTSWEFFVPTDVYLKNSGGGSQAIVVFIRRKPAGAVLSVNCGA